MCVCVCVVCVGFAICTDLWALVSELFVCLDAHVFYTKCVLVLSTGTYPTNPGAYFLGKSACGNTFGNIVIFKKDLNIDGIVFFCYYRVVLVWLWMKDIWEKV